MCSSHETDFPPIYNRHSVCSMFVGIVPRYIIPARFKGNKKQLSYDEFTGTAVKSFMMVVYQYQTRKFSGIKFRYQVTYCTTH